MKLKQETLDELDSFIIPMIQEARTFEDLLRIANIVDQLVVHEDV